MSGIALSECIGFLPSTAPILTLDHDLFGVLQSVQPIGDGLLQVIVSDMERLVDDSLFDVLRPLAGQVVTIIHADGKWGASARRMRSA